jgi:hypothetical protein
MKRGTVQHDKQFENRQPLWVLVFDVILRSPDLRRCAVSDVMSSDFCLRFMAFLQDAAVNSA